MATVKKGITVASPEWWKHLKRWKRNFWKRQRVSDKEFLRITCAEVEIEHPEARVAYTERLERYRDKFRREP